MTSLFINDDKSPERIQLEQRYIDIRYFLSTHRDDYEGGKVYAGLLIAGQTLSADALRAEIAACVKLILSRH
jgi:hypothetical protein